MKQSASSRDKIFVPTLVCSQSGALKTIPPGEHFTATLAHNPLPQRHNPGNQPSIRLHRQLQHPSLRQPRQHIQHVPVLRQTRLPRHRQRLAQGFTGGDSICLPTNWQPSRNSDNSLVVS